MGLLKVPVKVKKCSKCKVYPYDQVKPIVNGNNVSTLNILMCTNCDKTSLKFNIYEKTIENWNSLN